MAASEFQTFSQWKEYLSLKFIINGFCGNKFNQATTTAVAIEKILYRLFAVLEGASKNAFSIRDKTSAYIKYVIKAVTEE